MICNISCVLCFFRLFDKHLRSLYLNSKPIIFPLTISIAENNHHLRYYLASLHARRLLFFPTDFFISYTIIDPYHLIFVSVKSTRPISIVHLTPYVFCPRSYIRISQLKLYFPYCFNNTCLKM